MATVTETLKNLKQQIEQGKTEKTRAETNLESLQKQRKEIEAECKQLGVKPDQLDQEIERLETEIREGLAEAEGLLRPEEATAAATAS